MILTVRKIAVVMLMLRGSTVFLESAIVCLNLKVTGGGSDKPDGTLGEKLYTDTDKGILVDIYSSLSNYVMPGPELYSS